MKSTSKKLVLIAAFSIGTGLIHSVAEAATATIAMCHGDGATDDTACLSNAINETGASTINFPAGKTYVISNHLWVPAGLNLVGNGAKIVLKNPKPTSGQTIMSIFDIGGANVTISNMWLDYEAPSPLLNLVSGKEVDIGDGHINIRSNVNTVTLSKLYMTGANAKHGIFISGSNTHDITIDSNDIDGVGFGILANSTNLGKNIAVYPHDIMITNNHITNVKGDAIEINSPVFVTYGTAVGSGVKGVGINNVTISNNLLSAQYSATSGAGFCIGLAGVYNSVVYKNMLSSCKWQGVHIEDASDSITVLENSIMQVIGGKSDSSGILVLNSSNIFLLSNSILNSYSSGIELSWDAAGHYDESCAISGNTIYNSGQYGILVGAGASANMKTWIGPLGTRPGNTTTKSKLGSIMVGGSATGVTIKGNSGT